MNSAEEISKYKDHNSHYCSPVLARRTGGTSYDFPEKSPKKDKKWTLGSLFRRKKKNDSDSSSDEDHRNRNVLQKKKKKSDKRKRTNKGMGFDHIVVPPSSRHTISNGYKNHEDSMGILSEPSFTSRTMSKNFIPASDFTTRLVPLKDSQESLDRNGLPRSNNSSGSPSVSSLGRRKKEILKARAEARRDNSRGEESSDDGSQTSTFKSDESLAKPRDGSLSKRSRAARTQRYLKRRTKDEEQRDHMRTCKSDIEHDHSKNVPHLRLPDERMQNMKSASKSPILSTTPKSKLCYTNSAPPSRPNFSGLSTIPPSHSSHSKYRTLSLTNGSSYKQSSSFHDYNDTGNKCASTDFDNQRSLSCDADIHNTVPSPINVDEVVHVQFALGKPFSNRPNMIITQQVNTGKRQPPPPPPRDPRRILSVQNSDCRPISYSFETGFKPKHVFDQQLNKAQPPPETNYNFNPNCRSTSEDHILREPSQTFPVLPRPSSATPEINHLHKVSRTYPDSEENSTGYRYLADKNPRSRKPICIQPCNENDAVQSRDLVNGDSLNRSQKPFDFWKQKDEEFSRLNSRKSTVESPLMFTAQTHVRTNIFLPNGQKIETDNQSNQSDSLRRGASPFRPITPTKPPSPKQDQTEKEYNGSIDEVDLMKRKSSNLEDALDELEAIYNSLHLGDEDLLDRAEKREAAAAQKRRDAAFESYPNSVGRGALSDSSFGYDPTFDRRKRFLKRPEPDRKADDMAFRKLNKDRYNTISDPQSAVSRISYLLTSPVFNKSEEEVVPHNANNKNKEPDITLDDVVYRNVKHTNNALKTVNPQPPFGIPIGPILPACNSDYLHATPENTQRFTFKPKKIPDVVKDDLAYRNLRKDPNKEPALPQVNYSPEDYINNNNKPPETSKKKRAVRSLSANIFNLMHKEWKANGGSVNNEKKQNITDVADALEIAREILKNKEEKISATRKAFMSDGELKYRKFGSNSPTEYKLNFLNEMKCSNPSNNEKIYHHKLQVNIPAMDFDRLEAKPPTPDRRSSKPSTKESTPIPTTPSEDVQLKKQLQQSTIDELLTSLAVEAREASERITNELKLIGEEKERKRSLKDSSPLKDKLLNGSQEQSKENSPFCDKCNTQQENGDNMSLSSSEKKLKELDEDALSCSLSLHLSEGDSTSEHAKLCEKLLECVVESTELLAATKVEPELSEEVEQIKIEPLLPETVANIVQTTSNNSKLDVDPVSTEIFSESDHDYVNVQSTDETEKDVETEGDVTKSTDAAQDIEKENVTEPTDSVNELGSSTEMDEEEKELLLLDDDSVSADICMSPLEKHKAEIVAAFQELTKDSSLEKTKPKCRDEGDSSDTKGIEQTDKGGGEECFSVEYIALPTKGCAFVSEAHFDIGDVHREEAERYLNVCRFDFSSNAEDEPDIKDENLSETIADQETSIADSELYFNEVAENLDSLKSPKLVQNLSSNYKIISETQILLDDLATTIENDFGHGSNNSDPLAVDFTRSNCTKFDSNEQSDFQGDTGITPRSLENDTDNLEIYNINKKDTLVEVGLEECFEKYCDIACSENQNFSCNVNQNLINHEKFNPVSDNVSLKSQNLTHLPKSEKASCSESDLNPDTTKSVASSNSSENSKMYAPGHSESLLESSSRDTRHTLDEFQPSRTWYEDPAVIALACSFGVACTSQLPSFDILAALGLLFAIISLLIALIVRT